MKSFFLTFILLLIGVFSGNAQQNYSAATIGFMNCENLFDTIPSAGYIDGTKDYQDEFYHISIPVDDIPKYDTVNCKCSYKKENLAGKKVIRPLILTDEFIPSGPKGWNTEKYNQKLENLSFAISQMGADVTKTPPVIMGLVEVENRSVVEDLVKTPRLRPYDYGIVHYNSMDKRGIDVALIYQKNRFVISTTKKYELEVYNPNGYRDYTRDILRVSGYLDGEPITIIVNHWPSRSGGEAASAPKRDAAAKLLMQIFDEVRAENPKAKIIAMGDFNDDPVSPSIMKNLKPKGGKDKVNEGDIYNAMFSKFKDRKGTLAYRDGWNLFDQIMFTGTLMPTDYSTYQVNRTEIYSPSFMVEKEGQWKGYPRRMFGGDTYNPFGYTDHFPVYSILLRKVN